MKESFPRSSSFVGEGKTQSHMFWTFQCYSEKHRERIPWAMSWLREGGGGGKPL